MKNSMCRYHIFRADDYTDVIKNFNDELTSLSNKYNHKIFTRSPPASLLHCIEKILSHSSGKCRDSLTMATLSFTKSIGLCTIFIHQYISLATAYLSARRKDNTDTSLSFSTRANL